MVKSDNYGFEVKILQKTSEDETAGDFTNTSYVPFREVVSPLGNYVIAMPEQEFVIEVKSNDNRVYGAKLWIDEQEIFYKKTFKSRGFFMGFKLGEGRFKSFKFAPPTYENKECATNLITRSEIKIVFYRTTERYVSDENMFNRSIRKANDSYAPGVIKENKKFFRKSLTVQAGEVLYKPGLDKEDLLEKLKDRRSKKFKETKIDYDTILDTVVIHYGDFNSLLIQGVTSLANYEHLNIVPMDEIRKKPKIVERFLMTIIRKYRTTGLTLPQIEEEFTKIIKNDFQSLEVGPLLTFISGRYQLFQLDENNFLRCSETAKNIYLDLRDVDPELGIVPSNYYQTGVEVNFRKNGGFTQSAPSKLNAIKEKYSKASPPVIIDLTQD